MALTPCVSTSVCQSWARRSSYITGNIPGSLGMLDPNGICSQVIAGGLDIFPSLLVVFLQLEIAMLQSA